MRHVLIAALFSALTTFIAAASLRAGDATLAVVAVAATAALFTWLSAQHSTEDRSGLALANPASAITVTIAGRHSASLLGPIIAGQLIGAVLGGLAALGLDDQLGQALIWTDPTLAAVIAVLAVVGVLSAWLTAYIDSYLSEGLAAVPALLSGATLSVGFAAAINPAVVVGLATAGLIPWLTASVAAITVLVAAVVGALSLTLVGARAG